MKRKGVLEAALLTAAITAVLLLVTWQLASTPVSPDVRQLRSDVEFLSGELDALQARFARIEARNAVLERESDVLRQANRMLREQESIRQADFNRLQSELDFFRRLAGTGGAQEGLDIYHVELRPTGSSRVFQFVVTLTQNIRRASVISGDVVIEVEGVRDDRPVILGWTDLGDNHEAAPAFRFKYFQQLEGYLTLPEDFGPTRLVLTLDADDRRAPVQRGYDWSALLETEAAPSID
jgi:cell division protein FtsB